jgi:hypothetical protein
MQRDNSGSDGRLEVITDGGRKPAIATGSSTMGIGFTRGTKTALTMCLAVASAWLVTPAVAVSKETPSAPPQQLTAERYGRLPMLFERNDGQTDEQVRFLARGVGYSLFLTPGEAVFALRPAPQRGDTEMPDPAASPAAPGAVLRMSMHGGNPAPVLEAQGPQDGRSHYFRGADPAQWRTDVERFAKVLYRDVYPGIDLVYYGNQQQLEYDFIVGPGRDPDRIAIEFDGVQSLQINDAGELVLGTALGDIVQHKPVVYQRVGDARRPVEGRYRVLDDRRVGFELGDYDRGLALVIDPVLAYNTYIGGSADEHIAAIAVDPDGYIYVTGATASVDFPGSAGFAADGALDDVFVTKFNPHGNGVIYSAYLGGSATEFGIDLKVNRHGSVYVAGWTKSADFPTAAPMQSQFKGSQDGFVAQLNPAGNGLVFSTYLGGSLTDAIHAIALDERGAVYATGLTFSTDLPIANAFQPEYGGGFLPEYGGSPEDGFVTKLSPSGELLYSTYLGGNDSDIAFGIAVDSDGAAFVTGTTRSENFPLMMEPQPFKQGGLDAFLTKLDPSGDRLEFSTYYGGNQNDLGRDVDLDGIDMLYVGGTTLVGRGVLNDFPVLAAHQSEPGGDADGFVLGFKIDQQSPAKLPSLVFSTYYGGSGRDTIREVAAHEFGVFVVGDTVSTDLPLSRPAQDASGGDVDVFVGEFLHDGSMFFSTYFGGAGTDYGYAVAMLGSRNVYVGGSTTDTLQPQGAGRFNAGSGGGTEDAFVVRWGVRGLNNHTFDGNGVADVLWRNMVTGANAIWLSADATTQQTMASVPSQSWEIVGVGRFNEDLRTDVLWRNRDTGENMIWLSADKTTQKPVATVTNLDWEVAGVGDFDSDFELDDILWRNRRTGANSIWLSADHTTPKAIATVVSLEWNIVGVGDFNDDSTSDILWRNTGTGANAIWLSGNHATQQPIAAVRNRDWQIAGIGDFLADGRDDILWRNRRTGQNVIWRNGNASSVDKLPAAGLAWDIAAIGDYTGDGRHDILWRNRVDGRHSIWGSGTPTLPKPMTQVSNQAWKIIK